ncbi:MAG TPA: nitroreductase family deazaflavin-dependent oxidoreductase [Gaiellaceae bacterium]|nr:nitroreductase family deazaflavin-dependent oxidoreductase [Gaiellaceae bacterium]
MSSYNDAVIAEFRANGGKVGGTWAGRNLLLLTTRGRKTGREYTAPMAYTRDGDRLLVYASQGGAPTNPDWYENLVAHPDVTVEVGEERFDATATPLTGEERDRLFAEQVARSPQFGDYVVRAAPRIIPVVALARRA